MAFSLRGISLQAQQPSTGNSGSTLENIATTKKGAYVLYSSPLEKGVSVNTLLDDHPHKIAFAGKSGPLMLVVDLGKSYIMKGSKLKLERSSKVRIYVFKKKPNGNAPWSSLIASLKPDSVLDSSPDSGSFSGAEGEYLVFAFDSNPGFFSNLYITGIPSVDTGSMPNDQMREGPLGESPVPSSIIASP
jgi:hypothetical protein